MRGLLNVDRGFFPADNDFGFPDVDAFTDTILTDTDWYAYPDRRGVVCGASGIHFYCDDFTFEAVWNQPQRYIEWFQCFRYVVQPDFSLYYNFPVAVQMFNKYRNHWLARYFQFYGVRIIPNINISTPDCWDWTFLGYPKNSVVAISDIGTMRKSDDRAVFLAGYEEMVKRLTPRQIIYFTRNVSVAPAGVLPVEVRYGKR